MEKYVYLIKSEDSSRYKIGISKNPQKRVKQLQTGNSEKLCLVNTYLSEYYDKIERTLHNRFSYLKKEGEWFEFSLEEEVKFIDECTRIESSFKILQKNQNPFI